MTWFIFYMRILIVVIGEQTMEMKKYKTRLRQLDQQVTDSEEEEEEA